MLEECQTRQLRIVLKRISAERENTSGSDLESEAEVNKPAPSLAMAAGTWDTETETGPGTSQLFDVKEELFLPQEQNANYLVS